MAKPIVLTFAEVFTWTAPDNTQTIYFSIDPLLAGIANGTIPYDSVEAVLDQGWVNAWLVQRELNMRHVSALTQEQIDEPVLGAWMDGGSVLLIDGSHRYMARFLRGLPTVRWHILHQAEWKRYATITQL